MVEYTSANMWQEWFPEGRLADLLAGREVEADIGQVKGAWKAALAHEIKAGRLLKWRGKWFPEAGAPVGIGPDKTCYGTPKIAAYYAAFRKQFSASIVREG